MPNAGAWSNVETRTTSRTGCRFVAARRRRNASLASNCIRRAATPILASHDKEDAMATPTEHRANIITQDLARAEELTRRQYQTALDIAGPAGRENASLVSGVLQALALNFATFHGRRD
jgi:hypothetical protein